MYAALSSAQSRRLSGAPRAEQAVPAARDPDRMASVSCSECRRRTRALCGRSCRDVDRRSAEQRGPDARRWPQMAAHPNEHVDRVYGAAHPEFDDGVRGGRRAHGSRAALGHRQSTTAGEALGRLPVAQNRGAVSHDGLVRVRISPGHARHATPWLWRFHMAHHSDRAVDVSAFDGSAIYVGDGTINLSNYAGATPA